MNLIKTRWKIFLGGVTITTCFLLNGCYDDIVVPMPTPVVTGEVSFVQDIQPIFNASCNGVGCHNNGGVAPILTSNTAYGALINGGYIDTQNPSSSGLYQWMIGNGDIDMPPSGPIASANATVLAWIQQGALNN
ncbi:MAG: hypothetical protein OER04_09730 [Cyclobacteriaceae bacterium]|nr:hypothetical protein [Cyclobacteriaceae bacterium]